MPESRTAGGDAARGGPDDQCSARTNVVPSHLLRAAALAWVVALEHGETEEEARELAVSISDGMLTLMIEVDRGVTRTVDGHRRPLRFRLRVPSFARASTADGNEAASGDRVVAARSAGVWVRPADLVEALGRYAGDADGQGVLGDDAAVTIELSTDAPPGTSREVHVYPRGERAGGPRRVSVLRGLDAAELDDLQRPMTTAPQLGHLRSADLRQVGSIAHDTVGVLLDPALGGEGKQMRLRGALVGAGPDGVAAVSFATFGGDGQRPEMRESSKQGSLFPPTENPRPSAEAGDEKVATPMVLSRRLARVAGLVQGSYEETLRARQRADTAETARAVQAAAIAVTLRDATVGDAARDSALYVVGAHALPRAGGMLTSQSDAGVLDAALDAARAARTVLARELDPSSDADLMRVLGDVTDRLKCMRQDAETPSTPIPVALRTLLEEASAGDPALAAMTWAYLELGDGRSAGLERAVRIAVGDIRVRQVTASNDKDSLRYRDASALVRVAGPGASRMLDAVLSHVTPAHAPQWWAAFRQELEQRAVRPDVRARFESRDAEEACAALPPDGSVKSPVSSSRTGGDVSTSSPTASMLELPDKVRQRWLREVESEIQGRLTVDADGRVRAAFADPSFGAVEITDLAVDPEPTRYPIRRDDVRAALAAGAGAEWTARVGRTDFTESMFRVGALANPFAPASAEPRMNTVFVGRWEPGADADRAERALHALDPRVHVRPTPVDRVWVRHGTLVRPYRVARNAATDDLGPAVETAAAENDTELDPAPALDLTGSAGESTSEHLRVYGLGDDGEREHLMVPLLSAPRVRHGAAMAFALEAERSQALVAFIGTPELTIDGYHTHIRLLDSAGRRVAIIPTVAVADAPEMLRTLVAAAGVAASPRRVSMRRVIDQLRATAAPPVQRLQMAPRASDVGIGHAAGRATLGGPQPDLTTLHGALVSELSVERARDTSLAAPAAERADRSRARGAIPIDRVPDTPVPRASRVDDAPSAQVVLPPVATLPTATGEHALGRRRR